MILGRHATTINGLSTVGFSSAHYALLDHGSPLNPAMVSDGNGSCKNSQGPQCNFIFVKGFSV